MHSAQPKLSVDIDKDEEFDFCFVQVYKFITQEVHFRKDHRYCASTSISFFSLLLQNHGQLLQEMKSIYLKI
jgi:hypothetical protein